MRFIFLLFVGILAFSSHAAAGCWTAEELKGAAGDKTVRRHPSGVKETVLYLKTRPKEVLQERAGETAGLVKRVKLPEGMNHIALTFDLCEASGEVSGYDRGVVNFLREKRIPATLFIGGKWLRSHPEKGMQLMGDPLFELASHSYSHRDFTKLDREGILDEILAAQAAFEELSSKFQAKGCEKGALNLGVPTLFRFPYGNANRLALETLVSQGLTPIQWDVAPGDPSPSISAKALSAEILRKAKPGSIVILHANGRGRNTAEALEEAVPALLKAGYTFVTVGELLKAGKPEFMNVGIEWNSK